MRLQFIAVIEPESQLQRHDRRKGITKRRNEMACTQNTVCCVCLLHVRAQLHRSNDSDWNTIWFKLKFETHSFNWFIQISWLTIRSECDLLVGCVLLFLFYYYLYSSYTVFCWQQNFVRMYAFLFYFFSMCSHSHAHIFPVLLLNAHTFLFMDEMSFECWN